MRKIVLFIFSVTQLICFASSSTKAFDSVIERIRKAPGRVILANGNVAKPEVVGLQRRWNGDICSISIMNNSGNPIAIREVVAFDLQHRLPRETPIYAEGFQMLSQTSGTLASPKDIGAYTDRNHYKIAEPEGLRTVYGMMMMDIAKSGRLMLGFTASKKFTGRFSFDAQRLRISEDCENLILQPGQSWQMESLMVKSAFSRTGLLDALALAINKNHPKINKMPVPLGWCSWYWYGPDVTAKDVTENTDWIKKNMPELKYIQLDDGYQPLMGDWLEQGKAFGGGVQDVLNDIKQKGLEPAIWVAPFIASPGSKILKEHPDWFVKDSTGKPMPSDKVGFGGWRLGPWYVLDGTHPEVQKYFTELFTFMREKWGVTYFKFDANYWGAIHGGQHYDKDATRIEAYRRGMEAILKGTKDAFVLGCNHPLWASLGLIHGSRSSMDIERTWNSFTGIGRENLLRSWQNGRLWWNDPDCIVLANHSNSEIMDAGGKESSGPNVLPKNEFMFHASLIYATGGMLLNGDRLNKIPEDMQKVLKKTIPPTGVAAKFENEAFDIGVMHLKEKNVYVLLNWDDHPVSRTINLPKGKKFRLVDRFSGEDIGIHSGVFSIKSFPARYGRVIEATAIN